MSALTARLVHGPVVVLDGATGTALFDRGLPLDVAPERWVLERPDQVRAVHRAYVEAGAEAVHTCTFGAGEVRLAASDLAGRAREICARAVELAREAGPRWVLGSVGPTTAPPGAWVAAAGMSIATLADHGVDALHLETQVTLAEARSLLDHALRTDLPVLVSLAPGPDDGRTVGGDPLGPALSALLDAGATAVGVNCGLDPAQLLELVAALPGRLVLQPAAGVPDVIDGALRYPPIPSLTADLGALAQRGAAVGGCCGSTPAWVTAIRSARTT